MWAPMRLLFPWVSVIGLLLPMMRDSPAIALLVPLNFLQFPIYSLGLDFFANARVRWGAFAIGLTHMVAAGLAFALGGQL